MTRWKLLRRKWMYRIRRELFRSLEPRLSGALQLQLQERMAHYRALLRRGEPLPPLEETECRVFSQNGEDGILLFLLSVVGWEHRRFFEIGIQDGWECNCANLAKHLFWDGWFVEGSARHAALARQHLAFEPATRNRAVFVLESFVTRENVNALIEAHGIGPVDLFSLDIDGMDWWIWREITGLRPRIAIIEYNAAFGPQRPVTVPYRADFSRRAAHPSGLYYGASLAALVKLGSEKGYRFVGCNSSGVNAFFVRDDVAPPGLPALTAAQGFRENAAQNRAVPYREQFEAIRHLELITV
jgi:hypothetical protein